MQGKYLQEWCFYTFRPLFIRKGTPPHFAVRQRPRFFVSIGYLR